MNRQTVGPLKSLPPDPVAGHRPQRGARRPPRADRRAWSPGRTTRTPGIAETAVDAVLHERQLHHLRGEPLGRRPASFSPRKATRRRRHPSFRACIEAEPGGLIGAHQSRRDHAGQLLGDRALLAAPAVHREGDHQPEDRHHPCGVDTEVGRSDTEERRTVPDAVQQHRDQVAEADAADLRERISLFEREVHPDPVIVVNSGWANGAITNRSAAVTSELASVSALAM